MTNVLNVKFLPFDLGSSKNQPLLRTCDDLPGKYLNLISIGNENKPIDRSIDFYDQSAESQMRRYERENVTCSWFVRERIRLNLIIPHY